MVTLNVSKPSLSDVAANSSAIDPVPTRRWRALQVFNLYRVFLASIIIFNSSLEVGYIDVSQRFPEVFFSTSLIYGGFALVALLCGYRRFPDFYLQSMLQGLMDLFLLTILIYSSDGILTGLGILMNISIASISLLLPGRVSLFFAAVATVLLLIEQTFAYFGLLSPITSYFQVALHGISFFATAILAHVLSMRVRASEILASQRGIDLADLERLNAFIIQRLHSGVMVVDANWQVRLMNKAAFQALNIDDDKPMGHLRDASVNLASLLDKWQSETLAQARPLRTIMSNPDLIVNFTPLGDPREVATLIFLDDMTRMAQQAQQLKLASLGRFTASIAHELRNPLGAISHAVQLLQESQNLSKSESRLAEIIHEHCDRMNTVIKNILQISRRKKSEPTEVGLKSWIRTFVKDFIAMSNDKALIKFDIQPSNLKAFTDVTQLHQVLTNLCENCIRHGKKEGCDKVNILIRGRIALDSAEPYLEVIDDGPGINTDIIEYVYEPFYTTDRLGTGLGLYIAKELCEASQAVMTYIPTKVGACFRITFHRANNL